ncbi:nitroreductase family protein [Actinosynnema sp. CS-041913]|uniref:nitroreductase family protein n=1 Tax=Actinosynnema sp. CS-041913 TaxID=3239917 RepID=UPI003D8DD1C5
MRVLKTRSVVRDYTEKRVDDDVVESMLDALLSAPTGGNLQAWAFVVVRDPRRVAQLRAFSPGVIGSPALLLVACFDTFRYKGSMISSAGRLCVSMAVENFLLAAHAHGLGACPVSSFRVAPLCLLLELPDHLEPMLIVPVGYPAAEPERSQRRPREEVVSYEVYGRRDASSRA